MVIGAAAAFRAVSDTKMAEKINFNEIVFMRALQRVYNLV
jgi:hypothetical protein